MKEKELAVPRAADVRNSDSHCAKCAFLTSEDGCLCDSPNFGTPDGCIYYQKRCKAEE